jgi:DNA-binding winged helix-turn-helix (wHTH) protein
MSLRFAGCVLDVEARQLFRGRNEVELSPKAFETLRVLVESRPRALTKAELLDRVWPGVFVSEASVAKAVSEIRERLGDRAHGGRIVRTVHGYGYAFSANVEDDGPNQRRQSDAPPRACWLVSGARTLSLRSGEQILGRDPRTDLRLDSPKVSRQHARIVVADSHATIEDLGSKNGTFVRGVKISGPTVLQDGDKIRLGLLTFAFRMEDPPRSTETVGLSGSDPGGV